MEDKQKKILGIVALVATGGLFFASQSSKASAPENNATDPNAIQTTPPPSNGVHRGVPGMKILPYDRVRPGYNPLPATAQNIQIVASGRGHEMTNGLDGRSVANESLGGLRFPDRGMYIVSKVKTSVHPHAHGTMVAANVRSGMLIGIATGKYSKNAKGDTFIQLTVMDKDTHNKLYPIWVKFSDVLVTTEKEFKNIGSIPVLTLTKDQFHHAGGKMAIYANGKNADHAREVIAHSSVDILDANHTATGKVNPGTILGHPISEINTSKGKLVEFRSMNGFKWFVEKSKVHIK